MDFSTYTNEQLTYAEKDIREALALAIQMNDFKGARKYIDQLDQVYRLKWDRKVEAWRKEYGHQS